jgi:hypothetical protein
MHPKTIQRYIREGKLKANKVGKYWRVTGHDLSQFVEGEPTTEKTRKINPEGFGEKKIRVSSVVDIDVEDMDDGMRIVNTLTAALNSKPSEYGKNTLRAQYFKDEMKIQIMLWGDLKFMEYMLKSIDVMTSPE